MKQRNYILVLAALLLNIMTLKANAQSEDRVCIEGHVFDKTTKEAIAYASVAIEGTKIGTTTDEEGNFIFRSIAPGLSLIHI